MPGHCADQIGVHTKAAQIVLDFLATYNGAVELLSDCCGVPQMIRRQMCDQDEVDTLQVRYLDRAGRIGFEAGIDEQHTTVIEGNLKGGNAKELDVGGHAKLSGM
jgi:hypothetical protein